jgi:aminopeptidase C
MWQSQSELSVSFLAFYDAVEKVRKFLQLCREWRNEDLRSSRLLAWLLEDENTFADGGQMDMAIE